MNNGAFMPNDGPPEEEILQAALGPGNGCLSAEQLEKFVMEGSTPPAPLAEHVKSCVYCQTEVQLLGQFNAGAAGEVETEAVRLITARLRARSGEIFRSPSAEVEARKPWWNTLRGVRWFSPAALGLAGILAAVALSVQIWNAPPGLRAPRPEEEVLRSNEIVVIAPSGDVQQAPREIRWQAVRDAVRYEARLLEVDGTELWKAETPETRIELPVGVRARVVPAKTLLCRVLAFDASGHRVGESDTVRFRLLQ
jgi:hypothetical protein